MTLQTLLLAFTLSTLYGAGFHLVQGGSSRRLALYLLAGWLGFALGHFVGASLGISVLKVGALHIFSASAGSLVALLAARWLAASEALTPQK